MKDSLPSHTPGPWHFQSPDATVYGPTPHERIGETHIVAAEIGGNDDTQILANARLIAAAPELLEALQAFLVWKEEHAGNILSMAANRDPFGTTYTATKQSGTLAEVTLKARAAIAKATNS